MSTTLDEVLDGIPAHLRPQSAPSRETLIVLGVDVGKVRDPSAICAVRYDQRILSPGDPLANEPPVIETHYTVLGSERLPLGTSYPDVARRVNLLVTRLFNRDSKGHYHVLCDATGVGGPVIDMIREQVIAECRVTAVTLTGSSRGDNAILWRRECSIGKVWLVSRMQAILQSQRLHAPRDPLMQATIDELKVFEIRLNKTGHEQSGAFQVGEHDDLAIALGLGCAAEYQIVRYGASLY